MPTVTLMNWNIQNYGPTKSGTKFNNYDVVRVIARQVVDANVDIFCMLEVNTTSDATATAVCSIMRRALEIASPRRQEWQTCVISPNTGREFYAFFIRDTAFTKPMPISGPMGTFGPPTVLGPAPLHTRVTDAIFTGTTARWVLASRFPLLLPDRDRLSNSGQPLGPPTWPLFKRRPVLALFYVPTAAAANRLLPIFACHFAADQTEARRQIELLEYFSVLWQLSAGHGPPVQLQIDHNGTGAGPMQMNYVVTLGDFNIDYQRLKSGYATLEGTGAGQLGARVANATEKTHLVTYGNYTREMKTTRSLAVNLYDNFFTLVNTATTNRPAASAATIYDIPQGVQNRRLELNASVQHYAKLDKRGFAGSDPYKDLVSNFASQITGDRSHIINLKGSLVGARLISDHLPVTMQLTI